jgi:hypothetical protein
MLEWSQGSAMATGHPFEVVCGGVFIIGMLSTVQVARGAGFALVERLVNSALAGTAIQVETRAAFALQFA